MKLYEIDAAIFEAENNSVNEDGEIIDEELFKKLEELQLAREVKIENICLYTKNLKSDIEQLKKEADSFAQKAKAAERKLESLKGYLRWALNGEKFKTLKVSVSYRTTTSVEVNVPAELLPLEYQRVKTEPDKTELKEALESGKAIEGVELVSKQSIVIK